MGNFIFGPERTRVALEDRTLLHLRIVMLAKLRRAESFAFNWVGDESGKARTTTVWIHPAIDLAFEFDGTDELKVNRQWADQLMFSANSVRGLDLLPEQTAAASAADELSGAALPQ